MTQVVSAFQINWDKKVMEARKRNQYGTDIRKIDFRTAISLVRCRSYMWLALRKPYVRVQILTYFYDFKIP